jgi:CRISPR/Cas system CSM-associated protein Csm3 (group 7 of RAMP superfamily)
MAILQYKIEFTSFWHTGSGLSSGAESDLVVIKDKNGLPFIPGKTLKGLLRQAAHTINHFNNDLIEMEFINTIFGEKSEDGKTQNPKEAVAFFSDAYLSDDIREYLSDDKNKDQKQMLFKNLSSTRIDSNGQAVDHSLRQMQVSIPLELYAEVIDLPVEYQKQMEYCFSWVKKMGLNRSRGLGRCVLSTINIEK